MIDKVVLISKNQVQIIYTDREPVTITSTTYNVVDLAIPIINPLYRAPINDEDTIEIDIEDVA